MSRMTPFAVGLALPMTLIADVALADLTPGQVWSVWRDYMTGFGYQIDATETTQGKDLVVSDINLSFAIPEGQGSFEMSVGDMSFNQNGDGTVAIVFPDTIPMTMTGKDVGSGEDFSMTMTLSQTGHVMTASGSPDNLTYDYSAETLGMEMDQIMVDGQGPDGANAKMTFTGTNVSNTTNMAIGDLRRYDQVSAVDSATYAISFESPDGGGERADIQGAVQGLKMSGKGTIPLALPDMTDMSALMDAGFDMAGQITYDGGSANIDAENPQDGNFKAQTSSQGGSLDVAIGSDGIAYGGGQKDLKVTANVATLPFPIEFGMAESAFNLAMPVKKAEEAQDFAFGITMGSFTMSDLIWSLFDAAGQLPRDPATIKLDLSGKAKVLVDIMNPEAAAQATGAPGELETLSLNALLVDALGAKLEGSGAITMDGDGPSMVPGMGSPVGAVNLALAGGNGLLDKLVGIGLLPQEQAMGARMMMGIFTVPGDGPDTLKSEIQFTQDGQILANGQRIR